jgi:hypothetical protein
VQVITRDKTDAGVPAVQTLRNSIMAASFMATSVAAPAAPCLRLRVQRPAVQQEKLRLLQMT